MTSLFYMIQWCAIKMAERDGEYCEALLRDLNGDSLGSDTTSSVRYWNRLLVSKHKSDDNRRLILILDGVDEVDKDAFQELLAAHSTAKENCMIQLIMTTSTTISDVSANESKRIDLTRERICPDLRSFSRALCRNIPRLRKLGTFRKSLAIRVANNADCKEPNLDVAFC